MQGAGITPEAVPRKGREERNTGDRQRDSKEVVAGLRNATAERAWWFESRHRMKQKDATMVMGRRDGATAAAFGDRGTRGGKAGCAHVFVQGVAREF